MAAKRKRLGDSRYGQDGMDGSSRPSPHRPQNLDLAQQNPYHNEPSRGSRRGSRGLRGGRNAPAGRGFSSDSNAQPSASAPTMQPPLYPSETAPQPQVAPNPPQRIILTESSPSQLAELKIPFIPSSFTHLSEQVLESWQDHGKGSTVQKAVRLIEEQDFSQGSAIFQELLKAVVSGRLGATEAGSALRAILEELNIGDDPSLPGLLLDQFSENLDDEIRLKPALRGNLRAFLVSTNMSPALMRELLSSETLGFLGFTRTHFQNMAVRHATNVLYRQSAFNLLREETEGYSKLMMEYFTAAEQVTSATVTWEKVKALIGTFNMDPGRVLDVTLDVFATVFIRRTRFCVKMLRASSWWPQQKQVEGVQPEQSGFSALPAWAEPDAQSYELTNGERDKLIVSLQERDIRFWARVKEKGIKAFLELGGRRIVSGEDKAKEDLEKAQESRKVEEDLEDKEIAEAETDAKRQSLLRSKEEKSKEHRKATDELVWITTTNTFPPAGNTTAAQILGFKLRFYASLVREPGDELPDNLLALAALLIKIGFISLRDLYPHLYPMDEDMPARRKKLEEEKAERDKKSRPGVGDNALTRSAPLLDDTLPTTSLQVTARQREIEARATPSRTDVPTDKNKAATEDGVKIREPSDQKLYLLRRLLLIGAIPESLYILLRFPWLLDVDPELPKYVNRLLHYSLSKVYDDMDDITDLAHIQGAKPSPTKAENPDILLKPTPLKKPKKWMALEEVGAETDYVFYWEDWTDHVPVCQTVDDVFLLCGSLLNIIGVKIGQDADLLQKLIRIGSHSLRVDTSRKNLERWIDLCKRLLFPALCLTKHNPCIVHEMYDLMRNFSLEKRFNIYAECYLGSTSRLPDMKAAFDNVRAETKDVLKRISKENWKSMAKSLAKPALANAGIVFSVALNQLESYENIIEVFVDCGRYFSDLAYEVFTWSLLTSLGAGGRNRMQADGMLTSRWLKRLSVLTGQMHARYSRIKINPILQYLAFQLKEGNSTDLEILEETIKSMSGILSDTTYPEEQAMALAGGPILRQETYRALLDKRYDLHRSAQRLMASLKETNLAATILIVIAQERQLYAYREESSGAPLKVLGNNLDKIHRAFIQYLELLRFTNTVQEFNAFVPELSDLISDFGLDIPIAFEISRRSLRSRLAEIDKSVTDLKPQREQSQGTTPDPKLSLTSGGTPMADVSADVKMEDVATNGTLEGAHSAEDTDASQVQKTEEQGSSLLEPEDVTMTDTPNTAATPLPEAVVTSVLQPLDPALKEMAEQLEPILPSEITGSLNMLFFLRFWSMSLYDISVPSTGYSNADKILKDKIKAHAPDRRDTTKKSREKDEAKRALMAQKDKLAAEFKKHIRDKEATVSMLSKEKTRWFGEYPSSQNELGTVSNAIGDYCFFPRLVGSLTDAKYVNKFLWQLHNIATPGFRTAWIIDSMLKEKKLANFLFQCTEAEAENLGHFLNELLKVLHHWHSSQDLYEKEAWGRKQEYLGFVKEFKETTSEKVFISFEDFRRDLFKWHGNIHNAIKSSLASTDDMHIRNAIRCLVNMRKEFPAITYHGNQTLAAITKLANEETREDIKRMAQSALGGLKQMEKTWLMPQAFRLSENTGQKEQESEASATTTAPEASTADASVSNNDGALDPAAPEFKPSAQQTNGVPPKAVSEKGEVEDGEVEEESRRAESTNKETNANVQAATGDEEQSATGQKTETEAAAGGQPLRSKTPQPAMDVDQVPSRAATPAAPKGAPPPRPTTSSSTPNQRSTTTSSSLPPRPEPQAQGTAHSSSSRPAHALPSRPDVDPPRDRVLHHTGDRPPNFSRHIASHETRRGNPDGRLERPDDMPRYGSRGRGRERSPGHHSRQRTPERGPPSGYESRDGPRDGPRDGSNRDFSLSEARTARHAPRETRSSATLRPDIRNADPLPPRDRFDTGPRSSGPYSRPPANVASERPTSSERDRAPAATPDRAPSSQQANGPQQPPINSDRSDIIDRENRRRDASRSDRDLSDQRTSRPRSPHRDGPSSQRIEPAQDQRRDTRGPPSDRGPPPNYGPSRDRRTEPNLPPSGPRSLRPGPSDTTSSRPRESLPPQRPPADNAHGFRSDHEFSGPPRVQEPSSGPMATQDIPSGPRGRGRGRGSSRDYRFQEPISPAAPLPSTSAERAPFSRDTRRQDDAPTPHSQAPLQSPVTASSSADSTGIHPSRLSQIQPTTQTNPPSTAANLPPASAPSGPRGPSGPRSSSSGNFTAPSPSSRNPPSGPSSTERQDRRFSNLQSTLNQAGGADRGGSGRGHGGNAGPTGPPSTSQPPSGAPQQSPAAPTRPDAPPSRPEPPARRESLRSRIGPDHADGRPDSRSSHRSTSDREARRDDSGRDERPPRAPPAPPSDASRERDAAASVSATDDDGRPRRSLRDRPHARRDAPGPGPAPPRDDDPRNGGAPMRPPRYQHAPLGAGPPHGGMQGRLMGWEGRGPAGGGPLGADAIRNGDGRGRRLPGDRERRDERGRGGMGSVGLPGPAGLAGAVGRGAPPRKRGPGSDDASPVESKRPRRSEGP